MPGIHSLALRACKMSEPPERRPWSCVAPVETARHQKARGATGGPGPGDDRGRAGPSCAPARACGNHRIVKELDRSAPSIRSGQVGPDPPASANDVATPIDVDGDQIASTGPPLSRRELATPGRTEPP